jgi:hypothetical protein
VANLGAAVPVDVFSESEALAFLAERTGSADAEGAREVAAELGYLPLALAQAAAVITGQHLAQRCCAARRVTPSRTAISAHGYSALRSPGDGLADCVVQLGGQPGHVGQGVNVTVREPAGVSGIARRRKAAYSSFSTRPRRFGVHLLLTRIAWHDYPQRMDGRS